MAKSSLDPIDDHRTYTHVQIAALIGRAERPTKEWIRKNVTHCDFGNGLLLVSGRLWRLAIERLSKGPDSNEDPTNEAAP